MSRCIVPDRERAQEARRVTIGDVAAQAGVSVATVSKVINDRYGVAENTSARVRAVIDDLGYHASLVGQSLRSRRTNVIGVLVRDLEPFSAELLKGVARAIRDTGYELVVFSGLRTGGRPGRLGAALPLAHQRHTRRRRDPRHAGQHRRDVRHAGRRCRPQRPVVDPADRRLGEPEGRRRRDGVPARARASTDRLPRRTPRPRVGDPARARLPRGAAHCAGFRSTRA